MKTKFVLMLIFLYVVDSLGYAQVVPGSVVEENISGFLSAPAANYVRYGWHG